MGANEWRVRFREFCGPTRFEKMVRDFHQRIRRSDENLPYWQERLWDDFTRKNVDIPFTRDSLFSVLNVCPVHGSELLDDTVPILYGLIVWPADWFDARDESFPLANSIYLGGCCVEAWKFHDVRYCPECREAERAWQSERAQDDA